MGYLGICVKTTVKFTVITVHKTVKFNYDYILKSEISPKIMK